MAIVPPPQPGRPTMSWTIVLDVQPGFACVAEAERLNSLPVGSSVVLRLTHLPYGVDPRIVELISTAWRANSLHLELHGAVGPVGAWWRALTAPVQEAPVPRHLELIRGGADA